MQEKTHDQRTHSHDFKATRIIRTLLGAIVLLALIFDVAGLAGRVASNPAIAVVTFGAIGQVIKKEDVERMMNIVGGFYE